MNSKFKSNIQSTQVNAPFVNPEVVQRELENTDLSDAFKTHAVSASRQAIDKYAMDSESAASYDVLAKSRLAIEENSVLFRDNPKMYYEATEKTTRDIVYGNPDLPSEEKDRIFATLTNPKLDKYFQLQQSKLEENHIIGREKAIKEFNTLKSDFFNHAHEDVNISEKIETEFTDMLGKSNYGAKYITEAEKEYEINNFRTEYAYEAKWNNIDSMPLHEALKAVDDAGDVGYLDRLFSKTEQLDQLYDAEDEAINDRISGVIQHNIQQLRSDLPDYHLGVLTESAGDEVFTGVLMSEMAKYRPTTAGSAPRFVAQNTTLGMLSPEDINALYNSREIPNELRVELLDLATPKNPLEEHFFSERGKLIEEHSDHILTSDDVYSMQRFMLTNNESMPLMKEISATITSTLTGMQNSIRSGAVKTTEEISSSIAKLETKINGIKNTHTQLKKKVDFNNISLDDMRQNISKLKDFSGDMYGASIQDVEEYLDLYYG